MTFSTYLDSNNLRSDFDRSSSSGKVAIVNEWERAAHLDFRFRASAERHAEAEGVTDAMVEGAVNSLTCRSVGCDNIRQVDGPDTGMCRWCAEETAAFESLRNPYRRKFWNMAVFAIVTTGITIAVIIGVVQSGWGR